MKIAPTGASRLNSKQRSVEKKTNLVNASSTRCSCNHRNFNLYDEEAQLSHTCFRMLPRQKELQSETAMLKTLNQQSCHAKPTQWEFDQGTPSLCRSRRHLQLCPRIKMWEAEVQQFPLTHNSFPKTFRRFLHHHHNLHQKYSFQKRHVCQSYWALSGVAKLRQTRLLRALSLVPGAPTTASTIEMVLIPESTGRRNTECDDVYVPTHVKRQKKTRYAHRAAHRSKARERRLTSSR